MLLNQSWVLNFPCWKWVFIVFIDFSYSFYVILFRWCDELIFHCRFSLTNWWDRLISKRRRSFSSQKECFSFHNFFFNFTFIWELLIEAIEGCNLYCWGCCCVPSQITKFVRIKFEMCDPNWNNEPYISSPCRVLKIIIFLKYFYILQKNEKKKLRIAVDLHFIRVFTD